MKSRLRTLAILSTLIVIAVAIIVPTLSYVASQVLLRDRIESSLSRWTGQPVRLGDDLTIRYFPGLSADVNDLRIGVARPGEAPPLEVSQASIQLSLIDALFGEARLSSVVLVRPLLRVRSADMDGDGPAILDDILRRWIGTGSEPSPRGPAYLELRDGRVVTFDDNAPPLVANIEGRLTGLDADAPLHFEGGAIWRNTPVSGSLEIGQIRNLAQRIPTSVSAGLRSNLAEVSFQGTFDPAHRNWLRALTGEFAVDFERNCAAPGSCCPFSLPEALPDDISMKGDHCPGRRSRDTEPDGHCHWRPERYRQRRHHCAQR